MKPQNDDKSLPSPDLNYVYKSFFFFCIVNYIYFKMADKKVVLVTGGTGLVGSAIRYIVENEDKRENETYIFLSSKDADLTYIIL